MALTLRPVRPHETGWVRRIRATSRGRSTGWSGRLGPLAGSPSTRGPSTGGRCTSLTCRYRRRPRRLGDSAGAPCQPESLPSHRYRPLGLIPVPRTPKRAVAVGWCGSVSGQRSAAPNSPTPHREAHTREEVCARRLISGQGRSSCGFGGGPTTLTRATTVPILTSASTPGGFGTLASPCRVPTCARSATVAAHCTSTDQSRSPGLRPGLRTVPPRTSSPWDGRRRGTRRAHRHPTENQRTPAHRALAGHNP